MAEPSSISQYVIFLLYLRIVLVFSTVPVLLDEDSQLSTLAYSTNFSISLFCVDFIILSAPNSDSNSTKLNLNIYLTKRHYF